MPLFWLLVPTKSKVNIWRNNWRLYNWLKINLSSTYFLSILLLSNDAIVLAPRPNSANSTPTLSLSFLIDFDVTGGSTCSGFLATFRLSSLKTKMEMACSFKFPTKAFASRVFSSSWLIFNLLLTSEKWKQGTLAFSLLRIQHHLYTFIVWFISNLLSI